jgi:putative restriction endonuclease
MLQRAMALDPTEQARLRLEAFADLDLLIEARGGFATHAELTGFTLEGRSFPLIDPNRGIRNPAEFDATLSVVSAQDGPYDDHVGDDGLLRYAFRSGDSNTGDNRKLRVAMQQRVPIILFQKPLPNVYVPIMPSYVIGEDADAGFVFIATNDAAVRAFDSPQDALDRRYLARLIQQRVHQPMFRAQVMLAYDRTCAICRLKHPEMLDAAHIIADREAHGVAHVTNGLALCKIHHAAYDNNVLGIDPDYRVHIDAEILREVDGPMLKHGIQEMNGVELRLPKRRGDHPDRDALAERFTVFQR